jgi:hypothetical protein
MKLAEPSRFVCEVQDDIFKATYLTRPYPVWLTIVKGVMYKVEDELELAQKYLDQLSWEKT